MIDDARWRAITGQAPDDYAGGGWMSVASGGPPRIGPPGASASGEPGLQTSWIRTKSGTYRHFDVRAVPSGRATRHRVGRRQHRRHRAARGRGDARAADRAAVGGGAALRLQQATSMLAEALTVSQVVQVITEVGRSAIGADYSAVALLDDDKLRLSIVTPSQGADGDAVSVSRDEIRVSDQTVMSVAVRESRPFLAEHPDSLRLQLGHGEQDLFAQHTEERAWVGSPPRDGRPDRRAPLLVHPPEEITEEERVFLEALAGQCALAVEQALLFEREHRTELQRSLLPSDLPQLPGMVRPPAQPGDASRAGRRRLVRRVPPAGRPARRGRRGRHGQGSRRGRNASATPFAPSR